MLRTNTCQSDNNHNESEFTSTSAAEESCDTVIYLGPGGRCLSERDLTDFEHPPPPSSQQKTPVVSTTGTGSKPKPVMRVPPIIVHQPNNNKKTQQKSTHHDISNFSSNNSSKNVEPQKNHQNTSSNSKKRVLLPKQLSETIPSIKTNVNNGNDEAPIVVNINTNNMMNVMKPSLERAETTSSSFKQHVGSSKQQQTSDNSQYCFGQKTKDDFWVGHRRLNLPENFSSQNYSDSLPIRGKNRCYSVPSEPRDSNNNNRSTTSSYNNKKQRRKTESDAGNNSTIERLCKSTNSSPCKRGRSTTLTTFEDSSSSSHHHTRAMSLDRTLDHQRQQQHQQNDEDVEEITFREDNFRGSNETISSIATVENFERHLVSKIAERFAVEAEFSLGGDDKVIQTHNNNSEDFYIDDEIETISAGLDSGNPIDEYTNDYYNENYLSINNNNNNNNIVTSSGSIIDKVAVRDNDVIVCNTCIGECTCYSDDSTSPFFNLKRRGCDSAEDTDERTDKDLM